MKISKNTIIYHNKQNIQTIHQEIYLKIHPNTPEIYQITPKHTKNIIKKKQNNKKAKKGSSTKNIHLKCNIHQNNKRYPTKIYNYMKYTRSIPNTIRRITQLHKIHLK